MRRFFRYFAFIGAALCGALLLLAFQPVDLVPQTTVLYDGLLGGTPGEQGFSFVAFGATTTELYRDGVTVLDTTGDYAEQAGYLNQRQAVLDRQLGYKLYFDIQVVEELHNRPHRAGFSIIVLSEDLLGLELGFWEDEIWVQEGGSGDSLFKHAEGVAFSTTAELVSYELSVLGDAYELSADDLLLLSGPLRDYTAFDGFPDPYESPGLIFLGDNSGSAAAETGIAFVALETYSQATPTATETVEPTATLVIEPSQTPTATITRELTTTPTLEPSQTATTTASPTATLTVRATAVPRPADIRQVWLPCLKGVDVNVQK